MASEQHTNRRTLRPAQIAKKLGVSLPTVWRYARTDSTFPELFKLTPSVTVGFEDEIDAWVLSRRAASMPARTQLRAAQKPPTADAPVALLALVDACRARGLNTLDDLARALASTKANSRLVKAAATPRQGEGSASTRKRRVRAVTQQSEVDA